MINSCFSLLREAFFNTLLTAVAAALMQSIPGRLLAIELATQDRRSAEASRNMVERPSMNNRSSIGVK